MIVRRPVRREDKRWLGAFGRVDAEAQAGKFGTQEHLYAVHWETSLGQPIEFGGQAIVNPRQLVVFCGRI